MRWIVENITTISISVMKNEIKSARIGGRKRCQRDKRSMMDDLLVLRNHQALKIISKDDGPHKYMNLARLQRCFVAHGLWLSQGHAISGKYFLAKMNRIHLYDSFDLGLVKPFERAFWLQYCRIARRIPHERTTTGASS